MMIRQLQRLTRRGQSLYDEPVSDSIAPVVDCDFLTF